MATQYGLTADGFVIATLQDIIADLTSSLQLAFGASIDLSADSIFGQIMQIFAEQVALVWEAAEAVNASQDPDAATGAALDALSALTGTIRPPATYSTVTLTLTGTPTTVVPAGNQAATRSTNAAFTTLNDATITVLASWANTHAYVAGDRVTNASRCYQCTIGGTSAGSIGPTTTSSAITDGTVTWEYLGDGTGAIDVAAQSAVTGPIVGLAGDITVKLTAVGGWDNVINVNDALVGADLASDETLRALRIAELAAPGTSPADAIRADLLQLTNTNDPITAVIIYYNNTDATDINGTPPHSVQALVQGGDTQTILNQLFASVAAGIGTYGNTTGTVTDSEGTAQTVSFTRPTAVPIYVTITLTYDASAYPADGDTEVKAAIAAYGNALPIGRDAVAVSLGAQAFTVPGVLDVPRSGSEGGTLISTSASPTTDNTIVIDNFHVATYDTANFVVVSTPGTP